VNAERLHAIVDGLKEELQETQAAPLLQQLLQGLQDLSQQPGQPAPQQSVSVTRQQLSERLAAAPSNRYPPAWRQAITELGVDDVLGTQLRERIDAIFEQNELTPSAAASQLEPIASKVSQLDNALDQLQQGFGFFGIRAEELEPGEFEISFLIPRKTVENDLGSLGQEFRRIKLLLGPFLELAVGSRPDVEVRSIASSEFQVLLAGIPAATLMLAKSLDYLVSAYQKVIDMREARQMLKDAGASEETLGSATRDADSKMDQEIETLVDQLLKEADTKPNQGRRNELRKELRDALRGLARRIDQGYVIDVRVGELPAPSEEEDEAPSPETQRIRQIVDEVMSVQERLKFANLSGEPILELPEAVDDDDEPQAA
jgi:hypothetical protein